MTVDGKTVIVVEVSEGRQCPYYIKALGRDGGVYVRVAGTTRLADEYMATDDSMLQRNVACSKRQRKRYLLIVENTPVRFGSR